MNKIPWWDEYAHLFDRLADLITRHHLRVSIHPGQFTVLNSPDPAIVVASVDEIAWHVRFLDCLHADSTGKIVLHGGGTYGNKERAADRFVATVRGLPEAWRRRLVVENDERVFSVGEVLRLSHQTGLPVVFDWLHHWTNQGTGGDVGTLMSACFDTWRPADGPPKVALQ